MRTDLRGPAATGLLLLAVLTWIAVSPASGATPLAAVGVGAVLFRALFALAPVRRALQEHTDSLDLLLGCALVLMAMALTGGVRSAFALLLFVDLLLVRGLLGASAARFLCLMTLLGLGALAGASGPAPLADGGLAAFAARVLWPLPVLLAMEVTSPRAAAVEVEPPVAEPPAPRPRREPVPPAREEPAAREEPSPREEPPARTAAPRAAVPRAGGAAEAWSAVVHDLKSPLSVVRVYADLIAEQAARGEPARPDHLRNLAGEIELMETLLGSDPPARRSVAAPVPAARAELVRILGSLAESYRLAHADRLRVEFVAERAEVVVAVDPVSLQRVFRNLLDNAAKFTPPGGRVRVRVAADGSHGLVTVSDTGVGMTAEERTRAFEYSYRGPAARGVEGRGLGLGVSRELVEQSGGTIALSSEQGQGSDVTVRLPLVEGPGRMGSRS